MNRIITIPILFYSVSFFGQEKNNDFSQSGQDQFAFNISGSNGIYLEIGAHDPIVNSNTFNLEVQCNWKGISIELFLRVSKNLP